MNNQIDCNIIQDLLPLYHDNLVSEPTEASISEHLKVCESCRNAHELMATDLPLEQGQSPINKFEHTFSKHAKIQRTTRIVTIFIVCVTLAALAYGFLFSSPTLLLKQDRYDIAQVHKVLDEGEQSFFIQYFFDSKNSPYMIDTGQIIVKDGVGELKLIAKEAPLAPDFPTGTEFNTFNEVTRPLISGDGSDITELYFNNMLLWSEDSAPPTPEYVTEYFKLLVDSESFPSVQIYPESNTITLYKQVILDGNEYEEYEKVGSWNLETGEQIE